MSLVAQYLFNGNCNSETGNYNGTGSRMLMIYAPTGYNFGSRIATFDGWNNSTRSSISFPDYNWKSTWTVETWYKRYHTGMVDHFLHAGTNYGTDTLLHLGVNNGNKLMMGFYADDLQAPGTYTDSNWHHLVFTYNHSTRERQIFCDGVRVANDTAAAQLNAANTWYVGWYQENRNFCGALGNLRIYNEVISADTVLQHYNAEKADIPEYNYNYTGSVQTFTAPVTGYYKLEAWAGAGGGDSTRPGGMGGYSIGVVYCRKNQVLYVGVGGQGKTQTGSSLTANGGWNGGGAGMTYSANDAMGGGGGGATHIATQTGALASLSGSQSSVLMVAGGGAGSNYTNATNYGKGGNGGGHIGGNTYDYGSDNTNPGRTGNGGTQTAGGKDSGGNRQGSFGQGFNMIGAGGGGGGGWYGGSGASMGGGGAGSGCISNSSLLTYGGVTKHMHGYNVSTSSEPDTRTTSAANAHYSFLPDNNSRIEGFVQISLLEQVDPFKQAANLLMMM